MTVRSDRLVGPLLVAPSNSPTVLTVPAGQTWLVKRMCAQCNAGAGSHRIEWVVRAAGNAMAVYTPNVLAGLADDHDTWIALDPGAELVVVTPLTASFWISAYGSKLLGAA